MTFHHRSWHPNPYRMQNQLGKIVSLGFRSTSSVSHGPELQAIRHPEPAALDILHHLHRNNAALAVGGRDTLLALAEFGPIVPLNIRYIDEYALAVCEGDLNDTLPRQLAAAKPYLERETGQRWHLGKASLTTDTPPGDNKCASQPSPFFKMLRELEKGRLIETEDRSANTVTVIGASTNIEARVARARAEPVSYLKVKSGSMTRMQLQESLNRRPPPPAEYRPR